MNRSSIESVVLACLVVFAIGYIAIYGGFISVNTPIIEKTKESEHDSENLETKTKSPLTTIKDQTIYWKFSDSKGNKYTWYMPMESYENIIKMSEPQDYLKLKMPNGETVDVRDHTKFVGQHFAKTIDQIYDNSDSDEQFIYEVWYIVSQMTTYSYDIDEDPRWALETFSRGGGDCEDTAILIADMIRSSKHTSNWDVKLLYFDYYNPTNPKNVNHVLVEVRLGDETYDIESTAKTDEGLDRWAGTNIFGWRFDV